METALKGLGWTVEYHLNNGRRAYEIELSHFLRKPHFSVDTIRTAVRATDVCRTAMKVFD